MDAYEDMQKYKVALKNLAFSEAFNLLFTFPSLKRG